MHKNNKFTNKNTHKLNMQAEQDIPCERETESVSNSTRGRPRARRRRRMRQIARLRGRMRVFVWNDNEIERQITRLRGRIRVFMWKQLQIEREIARLRGLVCRYVLLCIVGYRWFKCGVIGRQGGLAVLELHELGYQVYFLNSRCHVRCHAGTEKWGTRAHQARVSQKVVYCYIFPKQCFGAKYFNN